jgi:hypothetical protein
VISFCHSPNTHIEARDEHTADTSLAHYTLPCVACKRHRPWTLVSALVDPSLRVISSREIVLCICRVGPDPHASDVRRHGRHVEDLEKSGGGKIRMRSRGLVVG